MFVIAEVSDDAFVPAKGLESIFFVLKTLLVTFSKDF
jgi:hypothetical protein